MMPTLQTERLVLRAPHLDDFEAYAAFYASDRARFIGGPMSLAEAWKTFANDLGHWLFKGFGFWSVDLDGRYVGQVGLHHPPHHADLELGWTLFEAAEGKGVAREAAVAARDWAWRVLKPTRLVSYIDAANLRSIALAEKLAAKRDEHAAETKADPQMLVYVHPAPGAMAA